MSNRDQYEPGPASGARVVKDGEQNWTLVLVRDLRHSREKVWQAITDPAQLREWAPFDADGSLATAGATVKLTTVGAPALHVTETKVTRADRPNLLEYNWGGFDMKWELEAAGKGTRLSLVQSGFRPDQKRESGGARYGWKMMGGKLVDLLARIP